MNIIESIQQNIQHIYLDKILYSYKKKISNYIYDNYDQEDETNIICNFILNLLNNKSSIIKNYMKSELTSLLILRKREDIRCLIMNYATSAFDRSR